MQLEYTIYLEYTIHTEDGVIMSWSCESRWLKDIQQQEVIYEAGINNSWRDWGGSDTICLSVHLSICPSIFLLCLFVYVGHFSTGSDFGIFYLSVHLPLCLSVHLSVCTSFHLSIHLSTYDWNKPVLIRGRGWSFMIYLKHPTIVIWPYRMSVMMSYIWYHTQIRSVASTTHCRTIQKEEMRLYARPAAIIRNSSEFQLILRTGTRDAANNSSVLFPLIFHCSDVMQGILSC